MAEEQRQWPQAEAHYQQALQIYGEFDDRYAQAGTYHQLGRVAQEQRQWDEARDRFLEALRRYVDADDKHNLAIVLRATARLWQESGNDQLPKDVADVIGVTAEEGELLLRKNARSIVAPTTRSPFVQSC